MQTRYTVTLAAIAGFGLGAVAIETIHAQAKPPVFYIAEIELLNADAYTKEYAPKAQATIKKHGGRLLAAGSKTTSFEGAPPKQRVAVQQWESIEQIQKWRSSPEYKEARQIGDKYAKFRGFAIEGVPQQ